MTWLCLQMHLQSEEAAQSTMSANDFLQNSGGNEHQSTDDSLARFLNDRYGGMQNNFGERIHWLEDKASNGLPSEEVEACSREAFEEWISCRKSIGLSQLRPTVQSPGTQPMSVLQVGPQMPVVEHPNSTALVLDMQQIRPPLVRQVGWLIASCVAGWLLDHSLSLSFHRRPGMQKRFCGMSAASV